MKITKIITVVNENNTYTEFIPLISAAWQKFAGIKPVIGFVTDRKQDDPSINKLRKFGDVKLLRPIDGVQSGIQAKISRMCLAASGEFTDDTCMLVDADMVPLSYDIMGVFNEAPEDCLVKWGYDHPAFAPGTPDFGKWPMDRTTAPGKIFEEIVNPNDLSYKELIKSWFGYYKYGREDVTLSFNVFSDESLLRALYEDWPRKSTNTYNLSRMTLEEEMLARRLDRSRLDHWDNLLDKLKNNKFIEVHGIRPMLKNLVFYKDILNFLGLEEQVYINCVQNYQIGGLL